MCSEQMLFFMLYVDCGVATGQILWSSTCFLFLYLARPRLLLSKQLFLTSFLHHYHHDRLTVFRATEFSFRAPHAALSMSSTYPNLP